MKGVPVRRRSGLEGRGDDSTCPGLVVEQEGPPQILGHFACIEAHLEIRPAAWRLAQDDSDGLRGENCVLRL